MELIECFKQLPKSMVMADLATLETEYHFTVRELMERYGGERGNDWHIGEQRYNFDSKVRKTIYTTGSDGKKLVVFREK